MSSVMPRTPEPELMDEDEQARAYSEADFAEPHQRFVDLFRERFPGGPSGVVLDLGCGPADVTARFARAFPGVEVHGVDGAEAMLRYGRERLAREGLAERVRLVHGYLPGADLPLDDYACVISNSLLHHLADPAALWNEVRSRGRPGADVFVMDLMRPASEEEAKWMVDTYAAGEPEVLRSDFFLSLKAAYRLDEIEDQLARAGLGGLRVEAVSDRHLIVLGQLGG